LKVVGLSKILEKQIGKLEIAAKSVTIQRN
jgi:hypothetical protein